MNDNPTAEELDGVLRHFGSSWNAAQAHGLLCGRTAVRGTAGGAEWLDRILQGVERDALEPGALSPLERFAESVWQRFAERQSEFEPLLPPDNRPQPLRAQALAHWCEGFLHGLVSGPHPEAVKNRLAQEPLAEIVKDMLQITRAGAQEDEDREGGEAAYAELVEYVRVAAQLVFEELAEARAVSHEQG